MCCHGCLGLADCQMSHPRLGRPESRALNMGLRVQNSLRSFPWKRVSHGDEGAVAGLPGEVLSFSEPISSL